MSNKNKYEVRCGDEKLALPDILTVENVYEILKMKAQHPEAYAERETWEAMADVIEAAFERELEKTCPDCMSRPVGKVRKVFSFGACPNCGWGVNSEMNYCDHCGQKLLWPSLEG